MEIEMVFQKKKKRNVFEFLADFSPQPSPPPQPGDYKGFKLADGEKKGGK